MVRSNDSEVARRLLAQQTPAKEIPCWDHLFPSSRQDAPQHNCTEQQNQKKKVQGYCVTSLRGSGSRATV